MDSKKGGVKANWMNFNLAFIEQMHGLFVEVPELEHGP
ncbi:hypothetical protein ADICYQ_1791 [Cyclobacterium qasimii M12-11B]|uniref:Uncharacterized protein n=1 Tax=Cyclobacterium qasimii M12-11B TaxID=641524 RepID=S7WYZ5_9BACT|nr:hypothetical protein ADICYQ_1791 [Cyclobacterium qasimii M12-11B]